MLLPKDEGSFFAQGGQRRAIITAVVMICGMLAALAAGMSKGRPTTLEQEAAFPIRDSFLWMNGAIRRTSGQEGQILWDGEPLLMERARAVGQSRARLVELAHWMPKPVRDGLKCCGSHGCGCGEAVADDPEAEAAVQLSGEGTNKVEGMSEPQSDEKPNPLAQWVDDSTVTQGTYEQQDESEKLINPWAYNSKAFDPRDDPDNLFDDDDPRER